MTHRSDLLLKVKQANPVPSETDLPFDVEATRPALGTLTDMAPTLTYEPERRPVWWRGPAIAFAALAALIVAISAVVLLRGDDTPVADTTTTVPATTAPVTTTTAAPTTTQAPATTTSVVEATGPFVTWTRIESDAFEGAMMHGVVEGGPGLVAFGVSESIDPDACGIRCGPGNLPGQDPWHPLAWVSTDGITWEKIDDPDVFTLGEWFGSDLASGPAGIVVAANHGTFHSTDGVTWTHRQDPSPNGVYAVARYRDGFIAGAGLGGPAAAVWLSDDGLEWSQVSSPAFEVDPTEGNPQIWDIAIAGDLIVAVGEVGFWETSTTGMAWVSDNGTDWERAVVPDESSLSSVSYHTPSGRFIAFGNRAIWASADGLEWTPLATAGNLSRGLPAPGSAAVWDGDRIVAAGWANALSLWESGDAGSTWIRVGQDDPAFEDDPVILGMVEFEGRIVAVGGRSPDYLGESAAVWIGTWEE